jgi:cell division protein FtsQ
MAADIRKFAKPTNQPAPTTNINVFPANATLQEYEWKRKLKRQQQSEQFWQNVWSVSTVSALAALVAWGATLPEWNIRSTKQIEIKGNQLLSSEILKKMLPISFPQSIFSVKPQEIASQIEKNAPVSNVKVERTLFPAQLVISLTERRPVARFSYKGVIGLIDPEGRLLPSQAYPMSMAKPELLLLAEDQSLIGKDWRNVYKTINGKSLGISQIDWREPNNLVLTTQFGKVHCGVFNKIKFERQMVILSQMNNNSFNQKLTESRVGKIAYIDLSDPQHPLIELM